MLASLLLVTLAASAAPIEIAAGPLTLRLHRSELAQSFHIADQLSGWSEFNHKQYAEELGKSPQTALTDKERSLLAAHAALRKRLGGWGSLEPMFYRDDDLESALRRVRDKFGAEAAATERALLTDFVPKLRPLIAARTAALETFAGAMRGRQAEVAAFAARASRFCMGSKVSVDAYLIASPTGGGGGYNGGVLTLEVGSTGDPFNVLLHESWHAFARTHDELFLAQVAANPGLDFETLSEAIAYAVWPGLYASGPQDRLQATVASDLAAHRGWDEPYVRFNRMALAVRPLLREALDDPAQNLATFLPKVVETWKALRSLSAALDRPFRPRFFVFGPEAKPAADRIAKREFDVWLRPLEAEALRTLIPKMRAGDRVVLTITADDLAHLAPQFAAYLAPVRAGLQKALASQHPFTGCLRVGDQQVLLFAAPDRTALRSIVEHEAILDELMVDGSPACSRAFQSW